MNPLTLGIILYPFSLLLALMSTSSGFTEAVITKLVTMETKIKT
jgi:hypothetical protein